MSALLTVKQLNFAYPGGPPVLRGVDLTLYAGERVALVGPIGSGKSTLLRLLVGLQAATGGGIFLDQQSCRVERDFIAVRRRVGLVFQDPRDQLFCPSVAEELAFGPLNLGLSRADTQARVTRVLQQLGLAGYEARLPWHLSGGEQRLVALGSVLTMEPDVLLLDEPSAGLDEASRARLLTVLQNLPQAMLLVSHDPTLPQHLAQRWLELRAGTLHDLPPPALA